MTHPPFFALRALSDTRAADLLALRLADVWAGPLLNPFWTSGSGHKTHLDTSSFLALANCLARLPRWLRSKPFKELFQ